MSTLLTAYYDAMNAQRMDEILTYLDPDIVVTFPEKERNWKGHDNVRLKFGGMFERMPLFKGVFEVTAEKPRGDRTVLHTSCTFMTDPDDPGTNTSREMVYFINNSSNKIYEIQHL